MGEKKQSTSTWMKLEPIIQSEVSQKEKHQYSIVTVYSNIYIPYI